MSTEVLHNEFVAAPIAFLDSVVKAELRGGAHLEHPAIMAGVLMHLRNMLAEIPFQASYCQPCGNDNSDPRNMTRTHPAVALKLRSCGHYSCDHCAKTCTDGFCANDMCGDCINTCEGCADPWCRDHIIAKNYCAECAPVGELQAIGRRAHLELVGDCMRDER